MSSPLPCCRLATFRSAFAAERCPDARALQFGPIGKPFSPPRHPHSVCQWASQTVSDAYIVVIFLFVSLLPFVAIFPRIARFDER